MMTRGTIQFIAIKYLHSLKTLITNDIKTNNIIIHYAENSFPMNSNADIVQLQAI